MTAENDLALAYHMGYDDALAKRKPDASKAQVLAPYDLAAENAKLRELVSELWVSCPVHDSDCDECQHKGGRTGCELYDRMRELGVEVYG